MFVYTSMFIEVKFDFIKIFEKINVLKKKILKSMEGVEVQENNARSAVTRPQMICALR